MSEATITYDLAQNNISRKNTDTRPEYSYCYNEQILPFITIVPWATLQKRKKEKSAA